MALAQTNHVQTRMAQRGISADDIAFVRAYGRLTRRTGIRFYFLGRDDIPAQARRSHGHLEGTTLLISADGDLLMTCYRSRRALGAIKRKPKRASRRR